MKAEDRGRSQTAGGWWEAAAFPTSFYFFHCFSFAPSIPLHRSHDQGSVLCASTSSIRIQVCAIGCMWVCVVVCRMIIRELMPGLPVGLVSTLLFQLNTDVKRTRLKQRGWVEHIQPTRQQKAPLRIRHNKHTGLIFCCLLTAFTPLQLHRN